MTRVIRTLLASTLLALPLAATAQLSAPPTTAQPVNRPLVLPDFTHPGSVPQDLARVDASLNATQSFSGSFTQYGPDGTVERGKAYLQRPGRMRFEYAAPNPLLVVADGVTLAYQDRALGTTDRVPLSATPFDYFLKENVNLAQDTEVVAFQKLPGEWRVTLRDGSGELDGTMTLVFDEGTLALRQWVTVDEFGGQTTVALSDLRYNETLDPRLFVLREETGRRDRRRRRR